MTITLFHKDGRWRVKRSDKEVATFTNRDFAVAMIVAVEWAGTEHAKLVLPESDWMNGGQIDFGLKEAE